MAGFSPFKRNANSFKYTPRYYDPLKEEFEKRREELRGERRESTSQSGENEYTPGQYIRNKRMARIESQKQAKQSKKKGQSWSMFIIIALFFLFITIIVPKLGEFFSMGSRTTQPKATEQTEEWNPYAPITVVPNDYTGE